MQLGFGEGYCLGDWFSSSYIIAALLRKCTNSSLWVFLFVDFCGFLLFLMVFWGMDLGFYEIGFFVIFVVVLEDCINFFFSWLDVDFFT